MYGVFTPEIFLNLSFYFMILTLLFSPVGKVQDFHRLPHIQDKYLSSLCHGSSLNHKLDSFRDGHEKPCYLRMSHSIKAKGYPIVIMSRKYPYDYKYGEIPESLLEDEI